MNVAGILEKISNQLQSYKAHTTHWARDDGVALLMSDKTWAEISKTAYAMVDAKKGSIGGCHVIRSTEVPHGQCYVVLPEGHDLIEELPTGKLVGMDPQPEYVSWEPHGTLSGLQASGTYTLTAGGSTFAYNTGPSMGIYQQAPTGLAYNEAPTKTGKTLTEEIWEKAQELKKKNLYPYPDPTPTGGKVPTKAQTEFTKKALGEPATPEEINAKAGQAAAAGVAKASQFPSVYNDPLVLHNMAKQNGKSAAYQEALQEAIKEADLHFTTKTWLIGDPIEFGDVQIMADPAVPQGSIGITVPKPQKKPKKKKAS